jgi:TolB-like protein
LLQRWAIDLTQIGNELGVRYAISVEQATLGLRINARLFDAQNGRHLWAERFDRNHGDLFPTQDEIVFYLARMS